MQILYSSKKVKVKRGEIYTDIETTNIRLFAYISASTCPIKKK